MAPYRGPKIICHDPHRVVFPPGDVPGIADVGSASPTAGEAWKEIPSDHTCIARSQFPGRGSKRCTFLCKFLVNCENLQSCFGWLRNNSKPQEMMPLGIPVSWGFNSACNTSEGRRGRYAALMHALLSMLRHFNSNNASSGLPICSILFRHHITSDFRIATLSAKKEKKEPPPSIPGAVPIGETD